MSRRVPVPGEDAGKGALVLPQVQLVQRQGVPRVDVVLSQKGQWIWQHRRNGTTTKPSICRVESGSDSTGQGLAWRRDTAGAGFGIFNPKPYGPATASRLRTDFRSADNGLRLRGKIFPPCDIAQNASNQATGNHRVAGQQEPK